MSGNNTYRYPGSRSFQDTDQDRKLFFGREREKEELLHKVLVKKLVVLYARSGLGKTSLIDAGVSRLLRENGCLPLKVRFNDTGTDPVQAVYRGIGGAARESGLDYDPGEEKSLWQYFKTAAFWSARDTLMTPVIILDQFEEFFAFHEPRVRKMFIHQLAHLVNGTIPPQLREGIEAGHPFPYGESPPQVKIVISIREDFLGQLEELCFAVPDILRSRYRLLALNRVQAGEAIIKPAQLQDENIRGPGFRYSEDAIASMLDYLSKGKEKSGAVIRDEVESFQLQLLCRHIETNIINKKGKEEGAAGVLIKKEDLGGESDMHNVLQNFYENQLAGLGAHLKKRRVRRLCEKGLISASGRRLSLEEEDIQRRFNITPAILGQLVDRRLLRAEKRVGSVYYELSHDTLVTPIRLSRRKRRARGNKIAFLILSPVFLVLIIMALSWWRESARQEEINNLYARAQSFAVDSKYDKAIEIYRQALRLNPQDPYTYNYLGFSFEKKGEYDTALKNYKKALEFDTGFYLAYMNIGNVYTKTGRYDEAIEFHKQAIALDPGYGLAYMNMGAAYNGKGHFDEAIKFYKKAIKLDPGIPEAYFNFGLSLLNKGEYDEAIKNFKKVLQLDPDEINTHYHMGLAFQFRGDNGNAIESYQKVLENKPDYPGLKTNLAELYLVTGHLHKALEMAGDALKIKNISICTANAMRCISISALSLQGKRLLAVTGLKKLLTDTREITGACELPWDYSFIKSFITRTKRLNEQDRRILLKLIHLLDSPKSKREQTIEELETLTGQGA